MKIYFEDGELKHYSEIPFRVDSVIQASRGVTQNIELLTALMNWNPNATIYTNSIFAFDNKYAWNDDVKAPEVFIRAGRNKEFIRIDKLTDKELRRPHNLAHMYVSGAFNTIKV